jgi:RNA polymerase II subunit A-like phosphatase
MPNDYDGSHSPIDDLKTFDWSGADDELAEFMGDDDSGDDSDASSVASDSSRSSHLSLRGVKRNHAQATDDEDSDEGSITAKKARISNSRTTGLKTVKTPSSAVSESSLPTPGPTDENEGEGYDGWGDSDGDLEAEMEAAFAQEAQEAADGGG